MCITRQWKNLDVRISTNTITIIAQRSDDKFFNVNAAFSATTSVLEVLKKVKAIIDSLEDKRNQKEASNS